MLSLSREAIHSSRFFGKDCPEKLVVIPAMTPEIIILHTDQFLSQVVSACLPSGEALSQLVIL